MRLEDRMKKLVKLITEIPRGWMEEMSTLSGEARIGSIVTTTLPTRSASKFVQAMVGARFLTNSPRLSVEG
jgi:hypothetical protein